jgi:hypothetical protein
MRLFVCYQGEPEKLVLLDTRNFYETRIGRFCWPDGTPALDPGTRNFGDFVRFADSHAAEWADKQVPLLSLFFAMSPTPTLVLFQHLLFFFF